MRRNPGFTAVAITALALGIGANTAIFSVVNGAILQPLPFPEPDRLVQLNESFPNGGHNGAVTIPKYMAWRNSEVFAATALFDQGVLNRTLGSGDPPIQLKTLHVSREFFQVFGGMPAMGRVFDRAEDLPGGPGTAILTYRVWQGRFGGDPRVVGRMSSRTPTRSSTVPRAVRNNRSPSITGSSISAHPPIVARRLPGLSVQL